MVVVAVTVTVVVVAVADVVDVVVIDEVEDFEEHPIKDAIKTRLIIIERKTAYLFLIK
jgi:geranylgeranyl pyrophosphate synthase